MVPADLELSALGRKLLDPASPLPLRLLAARGAAPAVAQGEILVLAILLREDPDVAVQEAASLFCAKAGKSHLDAAVNGSRSSASLRLVAGACRLDADCTCSIFRHASATDELRAELVQNASIDTLDRLITLDAILALSPLAVQALATHSLASEAVRNRCRELAAQYNMVLTPATETEVVAPPDAPLVEGESLAADTAIDAVISTLFAALAGPESEEGSEVAEAKRVLPLAKFLEGLSIAQKIRRATVGSAEERLILVRDSNRLVAEAAITSPRIQENEVIRIAGNRGVATDVLRRIGDSREWMKSYPIKVVLAQNPRTPLPMALRLLPMLRGSDLKRIAISRSVPTAVAQAAKREVQKKQD